MNTTAKGNKFEDKIYQIFKGLLEDEKLPVNRKQSVIKKKRNIIQKLEKAHNYRYIYWNDNGDIIFI